MVFCFKYLLEFIKILPTSIGSHKKWKWLSVEKYNGLRNTKTHINNIVTLFPEKITLYIYIYIERERERRENI